MSIGFWNPEVVPDYQDSCPVSAVVSTFKTIEFIEDQSSRRESCLARSADSSLPQ
jgi:hypothetical protein